jgi:predicted Zn-dependent protease with MMP-like domain
MKRMSLSKFGRIVARVMETVPEELRPHLDNVVVDVEEEPDLETLRRAGLTDEEIEEGESLFGWFDPLELPTDWSGEHHFGYTDRDLERFDDTPDPFGDGWEETLEG